MAINVIKFSFNKHKTVVLCVTEKNAEEILQYILDDKVISEFRKIRQSLFERLHIRTLYQKVKNTSSVYEMRFTNGRNDRIYCKQISKNNVTYIILEKLYTKKTQKIPKQLFSKLKNIDKNEYNI